MTGLTIDVGAGGWGLLVVGAFVIGVIAQRIGLAEGEDDWLPVWPAPSSAASSGAGAAAGLGAALAYWQPAP